MEVDKRREGNVMATVTKKELIYRISEKASQKKVVTKAIIQSFLDEIIEELARGNRLEFREFGVFELKDRAARKARNPRTGESVRVAAKKVVHFKPGRVMKERIQGLPVGHEGHAAGPAPKITPPAHGPTAPEPSASEPPSFTPGEGEG